MTNQQKRCFSSIGTLLMATTLLVSCSSASTEVPPPGTFTISIDSNIWTLPIAQKSVLVWFERPPQTSACQGKTLRLDASQLPGKNQLLFSPVCRDIAAIFGPFDAGKFDDDSRLREALAVHEALHAATQVGKFDQALRAVEIRSNQPADRDNLLVMQTYFKEIGTHLKSGNISCAALNASRQKLSEREWQAANTRARYEWPADYYMVHALRQSETQYLDLRVNKLPFVSPGDWLYLSGYYAMIQIEKRFPREAWQALYAKGLSPLQTLYVAAGCDSREDALSTDAAGSYYAASEIYTE